MRCKFCGDEGYAFCPLSSTTQGYPYADVWVPCPKCEIGKRRTLEPRAVKLLAGRDYTLLVVPLPERATGSEAKRMLDAISRTFYGARSKMPK